ncbi:hypothetical protein CY34DRAFT_94256 [Suillus luteus UH-Slu-Lm8-n1]|uniref:Reverse transcriptase zinc-binding domain-containing protein n=1 Tax=Suillus luteus UH-Slu-Lm8-n1 TaxID=930992 RepID=A0A0D0AEI6_9AGAM|nr:hypothetical protein CY34DRAFT_94256 [Suillus luteus UH-Slu-Lm8-n1]
MPPSGQTPDTKTYLKKTKQFIYKAIHSSQKIGEYWTNIPTYEQRAKCAHCNANEESMEHIMIDCPNNANSTIWSLAKRTWPLKYGAWPRVGIGTILGCGSLNLKQEHQNNELENNQTNKPMKGASRLLKILISESAQLIWAMRPSENPLRRGTTRTGVISFFFSPMQKIRDKHTTSVTTTYIA